MHKRAKDLISRLRLQPHPEGGYFREIFKSAHKVQRLDEKSVRSALTIIYFLLIKGQHGRGHRVASDEAWHFYEGDPMEVYWIDGRERCISKDLGQALQTLNRCAWCPLGVGKQQGLSESIASWMYPSLPDSSSKISRCFPTGQQRSHKSRRCMPRLPNLPRGLTNHWSEPP